MANEKRLIDANALESEISKMFISYGDGTYPGDYEAMINDETLVDVLETINEAPTVEAVEVVHGRWINKTKVIYGQEDVCYQCSHCETAYYYVAPERYNYCPNCGAKMDGDGNGNL